MPNDSKIAGEAKAKLSKGLSIAFERRSGTWSKKGTDNIGEGKDSEASDALIAIVKPDPRPIYTSVWGDSQSNTKTLVKAPKGFNDKT